jgi:uncharacterized protein
VNLLRRTANRGTVPAWRGYPAAFALEMTDVGPSYACTTSGEVDLGSQADRADATRAPLPVIQVESLAAIEAAVCGAGDRNTRPIFSFPVGHRCRFTCPSGNELAAMQSTQRDGALGLP